MEGQTFNSYHKQVLVKLSNMRNIQKRKGREGGRKMANFPLSGLLQEYSVSSTASSAYHQIPAADFCGHTRSICT